MILEDFDTPFQPPSNMLWTRRVIADEGASFYVGIGGNYYAVSTRKESLIEICSQIDKSPKSIYWNTKYACYAIRVKSQAHKEKLRWVMQTGKQLVP